ncbi:MAG TPA: histidinol-phosphate transaminase [Acidiferrobacteraceae bacterium]|nr:histidinol-phosphate transaminase [Acidiferrobacteraceae bacterium]
MTKRIEHWIRPSVRTLRAYHVADAGNMIKLDAMENPNIWPGELEQAWLQALGAVQINRYPDARAQELKDALRTYMDIPASLDIMLGNGSDELIQLLQLAVGGPGRKVLAPTPSFVMYEMIAAAVGMEFVAVSLRDSFDLDAHAMCVAIEEHQPALVFIAWPNNPTGNLFDTQALEAVIEASPGLVVIDEAYQPFSKKTWMSRLDQYDNLLVMRTLSKMGMAGLRLGVLAGKRAWLQEFEKIRLPYNINSLTQTGAAFVLEHQGLIGGQIEQICVERQRVIEALQAIAGVKVYPSHTNFILFRVENADTVFMRLKQSGILVKNLNGVSAALDSCLRVTIGLCKENDAFLSALVQAA